MRLIDEHRSVLCARNLPTLHASYHSLNKSLKESVTFRWQRHLVCHELLPTPGVEAFRAHLLLKALPCHRVLKPRGERDVEAKHKNGFRRYLGQMLRAITEDHRLPGARHAVDDPVPFAQTSCELFLLQV